MAHLKLGEILLQQGLINEDQLRESIQIQKKESGRIGESPHEQGGSHLDADDR